MPEPLVSIALPTKRHAYVIDSSIDLSLFPESLQMEVDFFDDLLRRHLMRALYRFPHVFQRLDDLGKPSYVMAHVCHADLARDLCCHAPRAGMHRPLSPNNLLARNTTAHQLFSS